MAPLALKRLDIEMETLVLLQMIQPFKHQRALGLGTRVCLADCVNLRDVTLEVNLPLTQVGTMRTGKLLMEMAFVNAGRGERETVCEGEGEGERGREGERERETSSYRR